MHSIKLPVFAGSLSPYLYPNSADYDLQKDPILLHQKLYLPQQ